MNWENDTKERKISMFEEIVVTEEEIKFNNLEKKYLNLYVIFDV